MIQAWLRSWWEESPCLLVLLCAMFFFFLAAPLKPAGDMHFVKLTAKTLIDTGFADSFIPHDLGPMQVMIEGKVYMAYSKNIALMYAGLHGLIFSWLGPALMAGAALALGVRRRFAALSCLLAGAGLLLLHWRISGDSLDSLMAVGQAFIAAGCLAVAARTALALGCPRDRLVLVLALIALGSFFSGAAKAYNRDAYYLLPCLAAICLTLEKRHLAAGMALAAGVFLRYEMALPLLICYAVYFFDQWLARPGPLRATLGAAWPYAVFPGLALGLTVLINAKVIFAAVSYVNSMHQGVSLDALYGLILSPGKGFFFYFPAAIVILFAVIRDRDRPPLAKFFLTIPVVYWLHVSMAGPWYGGVCWGPRYLTIAVFALAYLAVLHREVLTSKALIWLLAAGMAVNLPTLALDAGANMPYYYEINKARIETVPESPGRPYFVKEAAELSDAIFVPRFSPIVLEYETFGKWIARKRGSPYFDVMARFLLTGGK